MRLPATVGTKNPVNIVRMKQVTLKRKKIARAKPIEDTISETISFVIKGKLTPVKSSPIAKKGIRILSSKKIKEQAKSVKKMTQSQKIIKKENDVKPAAKVKNDVAKVKNDVTKKKVTKEPKQTKIKDVSTPTKAKIQESVPKNRKLAQNKETAANTNKEKTEKHNRNKKRQDASTKQTIAKLLKEANKAIKGPPRKVMKEKRKKNVDPKDIKKSKVKSVKTKPNLPEPQIKDKTQKAEIKQSPKRKVKVKAVEEPLMEETIVSDDVSVDQIKKEVVEEIPREIPKKETAKTQTKPKKVQKKQPSVTKKVSPETIKPKVVLVKKRTVVAKKRPKAKCKDDARMRKLKLLSLWNAPKRHRVASLNALAKVHCLYENESRGAILDNIETIKTEATAEKRATPVKEIEEPVPSTRTLRCVPGLRAVGKHWDLDDATSSSSDDEEIEKPTEIDIKTEKTESGTKKRRRNRTEIIMDLKDMVVRKRMASLNATAILAASYSVEKRAVKSPKSEDTESYTDTDDSYKVSSAKDSKKYSSEEVKQEDDKSVIEVRTTPNKKVAVIVNQDTDVTITGVYVNSTTRSTHHEGYCSIAGMQYRISATSHTQTAATAVATETLLHSSSTNNSQENTNTEPVAPCKSYTPLDALSSMQPPGGGAGGPHAASHQHVPQPPPSHMLPMGHQHGAPPADRRHGCGSAFSAPPSGPYSSPGHHHPPPPPPPPQAHGDQGYIHGYYQPAGPLISVPHGHTHSQPPGTKGTPASELSPTISPMPQTVHPPGPSSTGDSSDNEVIITSVTNAKDVIPPQPQQPPSHYRINQYPTHPPYPYSYAPQYYPPPPPHAAAFAHHDICYSPSPYLPHKYAHTTYRRYLPNPQYYQHGSTDIYSAPTVPTQQSQQIVTATPAAVGGNTYQTHPNPPPPPLMETYAPPAAAALVETFPHYYAGYGPAPPPPSCYTHSPQTRPVPYINAPTYQSCPCPMQSCPKNGLTGPLTGDSKRSNISSIAKESVPLPPVASLALPLEPASATGPPSPARGSAGMPPPPSPAGATYQPGATPKIETTEDCKPRKARVGKAMVRNNMAAANGVQQNTMLLMCHAPQSNYIGSVKREVESPKEAEQKKEEIQAPVVVQKDENVNSVHCNNNNASCKECSTSTTTTSTTVPVEETPCIERLQQDIPKLKTEEKTSDEESIKETPQETETIVKTVAENVKVKNMKRKVSLKPESEVLCSPPKKQKLEKANGSYKDLIKKNTNCVKINNGKRKLAEAISTKLCKLSKIKPKKTSTKRKLSPQKEETVQKRAKTSSKPLAASNLHNSKQNTKENSRTTINSDLSENKEPPNKKLKKSAQILKNSAKKLAPAVLDNLFAKNNVDRTIDSVVNDSLRTNKDASAIKCKNCKSDKNLSGNNNNNKKSTNLKTVPVKSKVECVSVGANKRKGKKSVEVVAQVICKPRRLLQCPRWSNGWTWEGDAFEAKVFINSDETVVIRKCYPAMRHKEGDTIEPRDCVLLKAGPRKNDLPFVAKIAALWESPDDGEMMMSLLWYYRPEHTEQGRLPVDQPDEVFASRHKDSNSVACIEDKCYVLTFNEYCRYRKSLRRLEEGIEDTVPCIPVPGPYPRIHRQPPSPLQTPADLVFFCRRVYDFRQKRIVKNPS